MSRWGKNIVVPLDSLCKEKENTNRPTVARSVGTVGKWGKMGFTSTRTYALSALPAAMAAAAAAAAASAASPSQSPASAVDDDLSPSVPEPPKPKKFFKSRNTTPPEVIAQIIQQLPRAPTSPIRDKDRDYNSSTAMTSCPSTPVREPIKIKFPTSAERKKKSPKKPIKMKIIEEAEEFDDIPTPDSPKIKSSESKLKKKKEVKKLKPETTPSRVTSRTRKTVNYCEDYEEERASTALKDTAIPKYKSLKGRENQDELTDSEETTPVLPPPIAPASKTPEHPPIVLRISKGTSRLISTDSEEQPIAGASPLQYDHPATPTENIGAQPNAPKIIVKPPKPLSPEQEASTVETTVSTPPVLNDDPSEINYCTVKISPDKPPKERLKLIIKTDVIRNAIAAAAAAEAAKTASTSEKVTPSEDTANAGGHVDRPEKEKKQKSKKHKHPKHPVIEQLQPANHATSGIEFKTPSPHLALGVVTNNDHTTAAQARTVISPPAPSERDFDSQSSVLGSISSKGNSTPQRLAQAVQDESCVVHSRGSSVITSDLETSQHSSLVAPPSDIESRLESMMMDGGESHQRETTTLIEEGPLQEDILAVLQGDELQKDTALAEIKINGTAEKDDDEKSNMIEEDQETNTRRLTRGRGRNALKNNQEKVQEKIQEDESQKPTAVTRTRGKKATATPPPVTNSKEIITNKRSTRRTVKRSEEATPLSPVVNMEVDETSTQPICIVENNEISPTKSEEENTPIDTATVPLSRRGRVTRNLSNNNIVNNNNNINKIAANLSAKAGAAEEAKGIISPTTTNSTATTTTTTTRSYGRKRKNQQVTQVLQPSAKELEEQQHLPTAPKVASLDLSVTNETDARTATSPVICNEQQSQISSLDLHDNNSNSISRPHSTTPSSPPRRDYKIKDKFKRTLTLDNQVNCNAVDPSAGESVNSDINAGIGSGSSGDLDEQQRGSVKLVISKKKGSIFKSRALGPSDQSEQSAATKRYLYKHRWDAEANGATGNDVANAPDLTKESVSPVNPHAPDDFDEDLSTEALSRGNSPSLSKIIRTTKVNTQAVSNPFDIDEDMDGPVNEPSSTTVNKTERKSKDFYTVVRNVKSAHQIQEIGEYQEMDDDVEYILDALQPHNPIPTRCLSALQLATKCMTPTFRMHVRAHGVVTKFFKALSDANSDLSLGLCTSAIMYILSQEGLNMDLDRDSLELMMNLLEAEGVAAPPDQANYERNRQKVRELCEEIKAQGKATHLNVDSITVGTLAMETLLSLTSKRAGEWFKEELRTLGGLEHIIKTISDCCRPVIECNETTNGVNWTQSLLDNLKTVERCMRVLENVTQMNEENQKYIVCYAQGSAMNTLCTLYCLCDRELSLHPTTEHTNKDDVGVLMRELLVPVMKVLINLSHTFNSANSPGADILGKRMDVIETSFNLLLQTSNCIPDRCIFELNILVLMLLINLTMHSLPNRTVIMKAFAPNKLINNHQESGSKTTAIQAVMDYFYKCEELARLVEKNTDAFLDNTDKNKKKQEEVDETVNNLLQKAGHHMEHTLKGSYASILIGHLITDNEEYENIVRKHLRGNSFKEIVSVLEKYYTFMNLTATSEASVVAHIKSTKKLIDYFRKRDLVYEMNESSDSAFPLNLETQHNDDDLKPLDASCSTAAAASNSSTRNAATTQRVYKTYSQR